MNDINLLLTFVQNHPELSLCNPAKVIDLSKTTDPKLHKVVTYLHSLLPSRLMRRDTGAPRLTALNLLEDQGWRINPTALTHTGWVGGRIQTRVGRIEF